MTTEPKSHDNINVPQFFAPGAKSTLDINGKCKKGCIIKLTNNNYCFSVCWSPRSVHKLWGVTLNNFARDWPTMVVDNILLPGHTLVSSFLCPSTPNPVPCTFFVSTKFLKQKFPASLISVMHLDHPDHDTRIKSYSEEKGGLLEQNVYMKILTEEYHRLRCEHNVPK